VPVYDAGRTAEGEPFYTMRLVQGRALDAVLAEAGDLAGRLALVRRVLDACHAVAYAHSMGVVHRDLKPANIMVGAFGETQVVDWGLAQVQGDVGFAGEPETAAADLTQDGAVVGTPSYMSPEQAAGGDATAASDVWSLGAVLFELLAGGPPFVGGTTTEVLTRVQRGRMEPMPPDAPPELVAVVQRALQPKPQHRYPDAQRLAEDLGRYIDGRRVQAYEYGAWDLLKRLVAAYRAPLSVAGVATLVLVAVIAGAFQRNAQDRDRALTAEADAKQALQASDASLALALQAQALDAMDRGIRAHAEILAARSLEITDSPDARGVLAAFAAQPRPTLLSRRARRDCALVDLDLARGRVLCGGDGTLTLWQDESVAWTLPLDAGRVALGPETAWVILTSDEALQLDLVTGDTLQRLPEIAMVWYLHVDHTDRAWVSANQMGTFVLDAQGVEHRWDRCGVDGLPAFDATDQGTVAVCEDGRLILADGSEVQTELHAGAHQVAAAIAVRDELLVAGTIAGRMLLVDMATGETLHMLQAGDEIANRVAWSPDGALVAGLIEGGEVVIWSPATGLELERLPSGHLPWLGWSDRRTLVVAGQDWRTWRLPESPGPLVFPWDAGVSSVRFHPQGHALAVSHGSGQIRVLDLTGRPLGSLWPTTRVAKQAAWSHDGALLSIVNATPPGLVLASWPDLQVQLQEDFGGRRTLFVGDHLVQSTYSKWFRVVEPDGRWSRRPVSTAVGDAATVPGGACAAIMADDEIQILDDAAALVDIVPVELPHAVDLSHDCQWAAYADYGSIRVVDRQGAVQAQWPVSELVLDLAYSNDSQLIAAAMFGGAILLWTPQGELVAVLRGHEARASTVDFHPDGHLLASGAWSGDVRLWSLDALTADPELLGAEISRDWGLSLADVLRE
jgi:WD40 repeat protein